MFFSTGPRNIAEVEIRYPVVFDESIGIPEGRSDTVSLEVKNGGHFSFKADYNVFTFFSLEVLECSFTAILEQW